jgi:photosystem II stability/assembly factor-like uncharacterized protein
VIGEANDAFNSATSKSYVVRQISRCAAGDNGTILCTNDGGATWKQGSIRGLSAPMPPLGSISLLDETHAWAVGGNSDPMKPSLTAPSSLVVRSDDGGLNWSVANLN